MSEPRKDRWIRLYDLGVIMAKNDQSLARLGRRALCKRVLRMVRTAERFHEERFSKQWQNRMYVNVSAVDRIYPMDGQRLGALEVNQAEIRQKVGRLERQSNSHGARIRNLERWREVSKRFLVEVAELERAENESEAAARSG